MSYLNALASDGLSVGLQFYTARLNERAAETSPFLSPAAAESTAAGAACPSEPEESTRQRARAAAPPPQSPEEIAAGRTEAQALLAEGGSLGQLQTKSRAEAENQAQASGAAEPTDEEQAQAAPLAVPAGGGKSLTPEEEREVARLKAQESQIKADVQASAKGGESGAGSVQYSYTTGPDDNRYISGVMGGGTGETDAGAAQIDPRQLSEEERKQVDEMEQRDREVKTHEQAHVAAASGLAGAPVYEYQTGPDGRRYAVGGHVDVKTSGSSNPDQALREAEAVKRAATAPADPSGADQAAASRASAEINRLKAEKTSDSGEEQYGGQDGNDSPTRLSSQDEADAAAKLGAAAVPNGSSFGQQVLGAYAAVKFGPSNAMVRPVLAQV